ELVQGHGSIHMRYRRSVRVRRENGVPRRVVDVERDVDGLEHVAVAGTESLIGRLDRELVLIVGVAMLEQIDALEARVELRARLRLAAALRRRALCSLAAATEAAVDDRPVERGGRVLGLVRGWELGWVPHARHRLRAADADGRDSQERCRD